MTAQPLVSVVLPSFNAERSVDVALGSLRRQTHPNLEILALDDGSTDGTTAVLDRHAAEDDRIRVLRSETNEGLISTLNRGVAAARGELVARMDADDISAPQRLEREVAALEHHPEIGVVGTGIDLVDQDGRSLRPRPVRCLGPGGARFMALLGTPLAHPSIVARAELLKKHPYRQSPGVLHTEDYELFARLLSAGVGFMNLPAQLVMVRADPGGVSLSNEELQVSNFVGCALEYFERTVGYRPRRSTHRVLVNRIDARTTGRDLKEGLELLDRVQQMFIAREPDAAADIRRAADIQRVDILVQAIRRGHRLRLQAGGLSFHYARRLLSSSSRGYVGSKLSFRARGARFAALVADR